MSPLRRTVCQVTPYLRCRARIDIPARWSRRIAAYRSALDFDRRIGAPQREKHSHRPTTRPQLPLKHSDIAFSGTTVTSALNDTRHYDSPTEPNVRTSPRSACSNLAPRRFTASSIRSCRVLCTVRSNVIVAVVELPLDHNGGSASSGR